MTEVYIGLAAIEAGLLAVFVASTFVLAQMARASFSLATPSFLLGQRRVLFLLATSALVVLVAIAGAIRTAFQTFEAFPGDQQTGIFTESAWLAVGLAIALLVTGVLAAWSLGRFVVSLQGPKLVREMVRSVKPERWGDWVKLGSPQDTDEYRRLQAQLFRGELTDPLAPLFEIANVALREGRYSLTDKVLQEVGWLLNVFPITNPGAKQGVSSEECIRAALPHFNDFVGTASSLGAESQVGIGLRHIAMLGMGEVASGNGSSAVRLSYELSVWASRFVATGQDANAVSAIRYLRSIGKSAAEKGDLETLGDVALALGKVGEEMAAHLKDERERLIPAGFTEPRYDNPLSSLSEAMENLTSSFTMYQRETRGEIHQARPLVDALLACCSAFLRSEPYGEQADDAAAAFVRYMGYLGIAGAKAAREDVASMVFWEIEKLYGLPNATPNVAKHFMKSACVAWFEMGIYVEANRALSKTSTPKLGSDLRDRLAGICALSGRQALSEGRSVSFYQSGLPINVEDQAKIDFRARVEARLEMGEGGQAGGPRS